MTASEDKNFAVTEDELREQIKPLPKNGFVRFFVKLYRRWLESWYSFSDNRKKSAELLQKIFFFLVFSVGVSVLQYLVMTFLPYAFKGLNDGPWGWPYVPVPLAGGQPYMIFGDAQGLGYFIAFEIAVFAAQCINFPLQRNYTYRSHGNPFVQAAWYLVGWVLISLLTNALWGICNCFLVYWGVPDAVTGIAKTMLTGIFSMVVFFFIFLIIFPDNEKLAKKARSRYEKALSKGAEAEKLAAMEEKAVELERRARISKAELALGKATSKASSAAMRYFNLKPEKDEGEGAFAERKLAAFEGACGAMAWKREALAEYERSVQR